jgi:hypothetical protein
MSVTIQDVSSAVLNAVRHFGAPYTAPCEFAGLSRVGSSSVYTAAFKDIRLSRGSGPLFTIDIDTAEHATPEAICDYVIARIDSYTDRRDNPRANPDRPPSQT